MTKKYFLNFFFVLIVFGIDRVSKFFVIKFAGINNQLNINVTQFLDINLIWNEGIAFGLFSFNQNIYYNLLTIFIFLIILVIIYLMSKSQGWEKFGYLLIVGGSLGNIFDRVYYSAVPDFIDIYFNNFHWFIFNVADIFITMGVIILISLEVFKKKI